MTSPLPAITPANPDLVPVTRPNGKVYRPRKGPRGIRIDDWDARDDDPNAWVYVLGTHDVERAYQLAIKISYGVQRDTAEQCWLRQTMRDGDACFDYDDVRGAASVTFEVIE